MSNLEQRVLRHVLSKDYKPAKPRDIGKTLGLDREASKEVRKVVKRLIREGKVAYGPNHIVLASKGGKGKGKGRTDDKRITGAFHRAAAGFGFIRPEGTKKSVGRDSDIYVPANSSADAANGDIVVARLEKKRRGKEMRDVGVIVEIIERKTHQFVRTYFEDNGSAYVQVDGNTFQQAVYVGDPGAKNANEGDKVVIEMVHFPKPGRTGEAVITEILGKHGQPGVDTQLIIAEFGLPGPFPEDAIQFARQSADEFDETNMEGRLDLTDVTVLTIDPKDARDFDDAISLERIENGHWKLGVHIADVAHFVGRGTALDKEAKNRATSIYLPDRVIPMLPEIISNNLASLQPEKVRYCKTAFIEFTPDGAVVATEARSAAIKSDRRFTYEEVDDFLENPIAWRRKLTPEIFKLLEMMHKLSMILRNRRKENGSLELSMPEVKIDLNKKGEVTGAHRVENTVSHQIIEEFMLAANMAVAEMLRDKEINFLRRTHENPNPKKLKLLTKFADHLGFQTESLESRFELQRLLGLVKDQPEEYAINFATLRSMQKAVYSPEDVGHFALASDCYSHFTSPIRRYPDLTIHRLIEDIENGKKKPGHDMGTLVQLGEHCSSREQRAEQAERELKKLKLLNFLNKRIGKKFEAVVTGVESFGMFVMGLKIPAEGLVHLDSIEDDVYDYEDTIHALTGRSSGKTFSLGDIVEVEIAVVDLDRRELDLKLIRRVSGRDQPRPRPKRESGSRGKGKGKGKPKAKGKGKPKAKGKSKPGKKKSGGKKKRKRK